jgi:hypothetical protein
VSDETEIYGYESSATLTTVGLHYKLQTRPLVREGASRRKAIVGQKKGKKKNFGHGRKGVPDTKTDRPTTQF